MWLDRVYLIAADAVLGLWRPDVVEAIRSHLIDSFGSGVILTGPGWLYVAPTYHAF